MGGRLRPAGTCVPAAVPRGVRRPVRAGPGRPAAGAARPGARPRRARRPLLPRGARALPGGGPADARDGLLLSLAQRAAAAGERELLLDGALLARLAGTGAAAGGPSAVPPASLDLLLQLRSASPEALAAGEFTLLVDSVSPGAGALAGRYAPLLGRAGRALAETVRDAPTDNPEAVRAQLSFRAPRPHTGSTARVPRLLPHVVALAEFADHSRPGTLTVADLEVVADRDRLAVVSRRLGREVVPTVPHLLATDAPDAARLLDALSRGGAGGRLRWRWGAAEALPYLPRVRSGRTVLSPARWLPTNPRCARRPTPTAGPTCWTPGAAAGGCRTRCAASATAGGSPST
nr:lantibiotic dehydratase [Kitasatospora cheerisanensis]